MWHGWSLLPGCSGNDSDLPQGPLPLGGTGAGPRCGRFWAVTMVTVRSDLASQYPLTIILLANDFKSELRVKWNQFCRRTIWISSRRGLCFYCDRPPEVIKTRDLSWQLRTVNPHVREVNVYLSVYSDLHQSPVTWSHQWTQVIHHRVSWPPSLDQQGSRGGIGDAIDKDNSKKQCLNVLCLALEVNVWIIFLLSEL